MGLVALILAVSVAAIGLYVFVVEPLWVLPWLEWITPNILYRVETQKALVALSFDDGPHAEFTPQVLEILERYEAKATFFLIGERALRHPELVARIQAAGHEIGNHYSKDGTLLVHSRARFVEELTWTGRAIAAAVADSGPDFGTVSEEKTGIETRPNVASCEEADIEDAALKGRFYTGQQMRKSNAIGEGKATLRFFRAPGGLAWPWQLRLAHERGYTCVLGCAYPHDPMRPPVPYMKWLIEKNLRPGTIVILHDGIRDATGSIAALPQILEEGKRRGLQFVSIGSLLDRAGRAAASKRSMP